MWDPLLITYFSASSHNFVCVTIQVAKATSAVCSISSTGIFNLTSKIYDRLRC